MQLMLFSHFVTWCRFVYIEIRDVVSVVIQLVVLYLIPIELLQVLITYVIPCCTVFTCAVMLCGGWNEANVSKFGGKHCLALTYLYIDSGC